MTTKHVVEDADLGSVARKCLEVQRRVLEGTITVEEANSRMQLCVIEGRSIELPPRDPAFWQARKYWDFGLARRIGYSSWESYLASVPSIPDFPAEYPAHFDQLVLVEKRLKDKEGCMDTKGMCELLNVDFDWGDNGVFVPYDEAKMANSDLYWMMCHDGRRNLSKSVSTCRKECQTFEVGGDVGEGLCIFANDPQVLWQRAMDLPGSVHRDSRDNAAYLKWFDRRPKLSAHWDFTADPDFGSAFRGSVIGT